MQRGLAMLLPLCFHAGLYFVATVTADSLEMMA